jgi:hypothetical protein
MAPDPMDAYRLTQSPTHEEAGLLDNFFCRGRKPHYDGTAPGLRAVRRLGQHWVAIVADGDSTADAIGRAKKAISGQFEGLECNSRRSGSRISVYEAPELAGCRKQVLEAAGGACNFPENSCKGWQAVVGYLPWKSLEAQRKPPEHISACPPSSSSTFFPHLQPTYSTPTYSLHQFS